MAILTFCLTAYGFINKNINHPAAPEGKCSTPNFLVDDALFMNEATKVPDLFYAVESRFMSRITREDLMKAESIIDIVPKKATHALDVYNEVRVAVIHKDGEVVEVGNGHGLNPKQKALLRTVNYSTDIHISADCKITNETTGELLDYDLVYYMSVIPETEVEYDGGMEAIIRYLKEESHAVTASIHSDLLKPGRVTFTIDSNGRLVNVMLDSSSGYKELDAKMTELLSSLPGNWKSATDSKGNPVAQELVLFFGMRGC